MRMQTVTTAVLAAHLGSPPQYGETAPAVLETCALVAGADEQWSEQQVSRFQEQVGIHEKVWGRLLTIHSCARWKEVDQSDLPENYSALYALTTLSDEAWTQLLKRKVLGRTLSSRFIISWEALVKAGASELQKKVEFMIACPEDKIEELKAILDQLKESTKEHGMVLMFKGSPPRGVGASATPEQIIEIISKELIVLLKEPLQDAGKVLRDSLDIQREEDLINAPVRDFLKFINRTAGSAADALKTYGKQYCLKLALEYNRTSNTRANRFNYKKKLEELSEQCSNEKLKGIARNIFRDYVGEVSGA